jgi:PucR C-terminal helix-turn-helix domain
MSHTAASRNVTNSARVALAEGIRRRIDEVEEAIYARVKSLPASEVVDAPEYVAGLRAAIKAAVALSIDAVEGSLDPNEPPPIPVVAQARRAARSGVGLETVLRRCAEGDRALGVVLGDEAGRVPRKIVREVEWVLSRTVDGLMAVVAEEYELEVARLEATPGDHVFDRARRVLAEELSADDVAGYRLDAWHVGIVAEEDVIGDLVREVARSQGWQHLVVAANRGQTWAWLGARTPPSADDLVPRLETLAKNGAVVGMGAERFGVAGWRLTHSEAQLGIELPRRDPPVVLRGADAVLPVAILRDRVLVESLQASYLEPLDQTGNRSGRELRRTLRAYLAAGQRVSAAAAVLKVDRHTVRDRLKSAEEAFGRRIEECHAELEIALRVEEFASGHEMPGSRSAPTL